MTADKTKTEIKKRSRRKRAGRAVFLAGLILLLIVIVSTLSISIVSSYSGTEISVPNYINFTMLIFVLGLLLVVAGLIAVVLPEGPSKDGTWVMMMSPFAGNN